MFEHHQDHHQHHRDKRRHPQPEPATRHLPVTLGQRRLSGKSIGGYGLLGLRGSWAATDELKLEAKLDNLLDHTHSRALYSYEGAYHPYREEGRTLLFSVTWTPAL